MGFYKRLCVTCVSVVCALSSSLFNSDKAAAAGTELCVDAASGLQIRLKPASGSKVVVTIEDGECGVWLRSPSRKSGSFVAVNYEGKTGWALSKLLSAVESQATVDQPASKALFPKDGEKCWLTGDADEIYNDKGNRLYCISGQYSLVSRDPRAGDECVFSLLDRGLACTRGRLVASVPGPLVEGNVANGSPATGPARQDRICGKVANPQIVSAIDREQVLRFGGSKCPTSHPFELAGWREVTCFREGGNARDSFLLGPNQDCRSAGYDGEAGKDSVTVSPNAARPVTNATAASPTPSTAYRISTSDQSRLDQYAAALTALSNHMYKYYPSYAWPLKGSCSNDRVATARDAWLDSTLWNFIKKGYSVREVEADFLRVCSAVLASSAR